VASLQEQAGADVVLKTLGTGLHPRRSKSLATFCSPVIAACSFRDALMLTGNVTDDDASRRQTAPCCGSPSPMPSRDRRRTKSSSPSAKVPLRPVEDARPASTDQPPSLRRPSRGSRRSCGTTSTQRPRQILVPAVWICGGPAGAIPAGLPGDGLAALALQRQRARQHPCRVLPLRRGRPRRVGQPHRW
jgi:hypothetical protein